MNNVWKTMSLSIDSGKKVFRSLVFIVTVLSATCSNGEPLSKLPGTIVDAYEAVSAYVFIPKGPVKNNNGSFELGLGTADVFPGYLFRYKPYDKARLEMLKKKPPASQVVSDEHHSGAKSLQLILDVPTRTPLVNFRAPFIGLDKQRKKLTLSFWIKASQPGVRANMFISEAQGSLQRLRNKVLATKWTRITGTLESNIDFPGVRLEFSSGKGTATKIWIDDVTWSEDKPEDYKVPKAEILIKPLSRDGIIFKGKKFNISWSLRGASSRGVETALYLRDATRGGITTRLTRKKVSISPTSSQVSFECPPLPPGKYMLAAVARDASTKEVLAQDHQLFAVLTDLRKLPKPVKFGMGAMFVFDEPQGFFHHGINSLDDLYRVNAAIGCRLIRDLHIWEKVEPKYKKRDWPYYDYLMGVADKYGCGFMFDIPGAPFKIRAGRLERRKKEGYWFVARGHLLGLKKQLLDEKNLKEDEFVAINKSDTFWYPEAADTRDFCKEFMGRYKNKGLWVVEYKNEVNAMVPAKINVEKFMKPFYQIMKKAAPNIPVTVNNTGGARLKYLQQLIDAGGLPYMDGYTFHPYEHGMLMFDSLSDVRMYRTYLDKLSPGRKLLLGQSEILFLNTFTVQRMLSDWVGGCRWSCGIPWRCLYASMHGSYNRWHDTGPLLPGVNGVHLNGLNAVLSGARLVGSSKAIPKTLIAFFEKSVGGKKQYVSALCVEYRAGKALLLKAKGLESLHCRAYDISGAPRSLPIFPEGVLLTEDALYLSCDSPKLFKALSTSNCEWVNYAQAAVSVRELGIANKMLTGTPLKKNMSVLDLWSGGKFAKIVSGGGGVALKPLPCDSVSGCIWPKSSTGKPLNYITTTIYSEKPCVKSLFMSFHGVSAAVVFLGGKQVKKIVVPAKGSLGENWLGLSIHLKAGANKLELFLKNKIAKPIAQICLKAPKKARMVDLVGLSSSSSEIERTLAPGVFVHTDDMRGPDQGKARGAFGKLGPASLLLPEKEMDHITFRANKKGNPALRLVFVDDKPRVVDKYVIHPRVSWFPRNFDFQGSNDGKNWTTLDKVRNFVSRKRQHLEREFDNGKGYKMYRFNFDIHKGGTILISFKGVRLIDRKRKH
jgi:hypothetical protein